MRAFEQTSWTPERDKELIDGWNRGETQGKLADALGVTKSTVAGRINRLRKQGVDLTRRKDVAQQNRQSGRAAKPAVQSFIAHRQAIAARQAKAALKLEEATPTARQCTTRFDDLRPKQCRYPGDTDAEGNYLFCNSDRLGPEYSYCATHHRICKQGFPRRKLTKK